MLKLMRFLKPYKWTVFFIMIITFMQTLGTLLIPAYTARIINNGVIYGDIDYIIDTGITMLGIAFLAGIASIISMYLASKLGAAFGRDVRLAIFEKATFFSINDFDNIGSSSMITRTTSDVNNVQLATIYILQFMLPAPLMAIGGFMLSFSKDPMLTIVLVIVLLVLSSIAYFMFVSVIPLYLQMQGKMDNMNKVLREIITGVRVIRAFDGENQEKNRFSGPAMDYASTAIKINKIFSFFLPLVILGMNLSMIAILWVGSFRVGTGNLQIGDIMAVMEYSFFISMAVLMSAFVLVFASRAEVSAERVNKVLDIDTEIKDGNYDVSKLDSKVTLEFKNVTFAYPDAEEAVLSNINFKAEAGETVAIIGGTGSGKSTLVNLLPRFHDISSGSILLNGIDIRELAQKDLRSKLGYIPQKPFLFSGTIKDSIGYGSENASMEDIIYATETSQSKEFIESKEKKYDEPISQSGSNLSGGQKQRLSIARALARKPDIYIFDDSFSALDYKTDANLRKALKLEVKNSISIIVAQRISTIMDADKILVLDEGKLVGVGKHKDLLKSCQIYNQFATSQLNEAELA